MKKPKDMKVSKTVIAFSIGVALAIAGVAYAFQSQTANIVVENIEQAMFGASGSDMGGMLGGDGTSATAGSLSIGNDLTVTDDTTLGDDVSIGGDLTMSGGNLAITGALTVDEFTQGGGCYASTTVAATETWTQAVMAANNCFEYNGATASAITITLPATSTMTTLIPNVGDTRSWIYQGYTAAATTTTWAAGTGIDLIAYTTNDDVIDGNEYAEITCWRMTDTDVTCLVSELVHSD